MAIHANQVRGELRNVPVRGADVLPIFKGGGRPARLDIRGGGDIRMAGSEGAGSDSGVHGQMAKRSKYRKVKDGVRVFDVAVLGLWVVFCAWLVIK